MNRVLTTGMTLVLVAVASLVSRAQGPGRGGGGGMQQQRKLVAQFDKNGDNRLDAAERSAARASLGAQPAGGRGGRGGFGGGGATGAAAPGRRLSPADVKSFPGVPLYDAATLRTIFVQFDAADWEAELTAFNNTDVEVPALVTVDGTTYKDVGVHFRGASSFFMTPATFKKSLNLSFDFVNEAQNLGGYKTLNLLNAASDPTLLRAVLYSHISSQYIPSPKMNYLRVVINGESWGVYPSAQQFNKDFVRDFFNATGGARWKVPGSPGGRAGLNYLGENVDSYKQLYEIASKDDPKSWADLIRLTKVLGETPPERLEAALAPLLDVDGALKFLAIEVALMNTDGYWTRASDYSIYQDQRGVFHIIPHDVNEAMGIADGGRGGGGGAALDPLVGLNDQTKALRSKLLAVPALRAKYLSYVRDIAERWLDWKVLGPIAQRYHDLIAADVRTDTKKLYSSAEFDAGLTGSLKTWADSRRAFLLSYGR